MKEVDERVVEMRFDNKKFESNAKETMSTLDRLKEKLNFGSAGKSIDEIEESANSVNFNRMIESIDAINSHFSVMGIAGKRIIENLTDSVMSFANKTVGYVTNSIVQGGKNRALNIEQARFQLYTLLQDETKVSEIMQDALDSVDGTAYAFDEAAKAASMFASSGVTGGEQMQAALKAISGTAAATGSDYTGLARVFTQVAGKGALMGDELLQLSERGVNAAAILRDYYAQTAEYADLTEADIREMASNREISFETFVDAFNDKFKDSAHLANETFSGVTANIRSAFAKIGAGFIQPLISQNSDVVGMLNILREKINDVKKVLVFDEAIGNTNALSKQFTDAVLSMSRSLGSWLEDLDLTTPLELLYYNIEITKNLFKGLGTVLEPIGKAFAKVFGEFLGGNNIIKAANALESFTSKLRLSAQDSKNLEDAFTGLFTIARLLVQILLKIAKALSPIRKPLKSILTITLELLGAIGRSITKFDEWIHQSKYIAAAYEIISDAIDTMCTWIADGLIYIAEFVKLVAKSETLSNFIIALRDAFGRLFDLLLPDLDISIDGFEDLKEQLLEFVSEKTYQLIIKVGEGMRELTDIINNMTFEDAAEGFHNFKEAIVDLLNSSSGPEGLSVFIANMKDFGSNMGDAFNFSNMINNIDAAKESIDGFTSWLGDKVQPIIDQMSFGGIVATGGGLAMIYSVIKMAKSWESVAKSIQSIPKLLNSVSSTLITYQTKIKAEAFKEIAIGIAILTASVIALSFVDSEKAIAAATALGILAVALGTGASLLLTALAKVNSTIKPMDKIASGFSDMLKKFGKAVSVKAMGSAIKDFATSIALIAGSIIALGLLHSKDPEAFEAGAKAVAAIGAVLAGFAVLIAFIAKKMDAKQLYAASSIGKSVQKLAEALLIVVIAIKMLMKIKLPRDHRVKEKLLKDILMMMAGLAIVVGVAGRISKGNSTSAKPVISIAVALLLVVKSVKELMAINLPEDYETKMDILKQIFRRLEELVIVLGVVAKISGGKIKAAGTVLAMAGFVFAIVIALKVLQTIPIDKMKAGAIGLGAVLLELGTAIALATKNNNKDAWKTVLAMAVMVGTITMSLGILSMIPFDNLLKATLALGAVLLALGKTFEGLSKQGDTDYQGVMAVMIVLAEIAIILGNLAKYDWKSLLAAGIAMNLTMSAFSKSMESLSNINAKKLNDSKMKKIMQGLGYLAGVALIFTATAVVLQDAGVTPATMIGTATALSETMIAYGVFFKIINGTKVNKSVIEAIVPTLTATGLIAAEFAVIATQFQKSGVTPATMLGTATAMSELMIAYAAIFRIINGVKVDKSTIAAFDAGVIGVAGIAASLIAVVLALKDVESDKILIISTALSEVIAVYGGIFTLIGKFAGSVDLVTIAAFDSGVIAVIGIAASLGELILALQDCPPEIIKTTSDGLSEALIAFAAVFAVITKFAAPASTAIAGIAEFEGFIAAFIALMGTIGGIVDTFGLGDEIQAGLDILVMVGEGIGKFIGVIIEQIGTGIGNGLKGILKGLGEGLTGFIDTSKGFMDAMKDIDSKVFNNIKLLSQSILLLTGSEILDGLTLFIGKKASLTKFASQLSAASGNIVNFAKKMSELSPSELQGAENGMKIIKLMAQTAAAIPRDGGLWGALAGKRDSIDKFTSRLGKVATQSPGLMEFVNKFKSIKGTEIDGAANVLSKMADVADSLPRTGPSVWGALAGDKDTIEEFTKRLGKVANQNPGLKEFINKFKSVKGTEIDGAASVISKMADVAKSLPSDGGLWGSLFGETISFDDFCAELGSAAPNLKAFLEVATNVSTNKVSVGVQAIADLVDIFAKIGEGTAVNGLAYVGDDFFSSFAGWAEEALMGFNEVFDTSLKPYKDSVSTLQTFFNSLANSINNDKLLSKFNTAGTTARNKFISGISAQSSKVALFGTASSLITQIYNGLVSGSSRIMTLGSSIPTWIRSGMFSKDSIMKIQQTSTLLNNTLMSNIGDQVKSYEVTHNISRHIRAAAQDNTTKTYLNSAGYWILTRVIEGINKNISLIIDVGTNAAQGFIDGVKKKTKEIKSVGTTLGKFLSKAAQKSLDEHSPSKVMRKIGDFAGAGLVLGVKDKLKEVSKSGSELGNSLFDSTNHAISNLSRIFTDDMDLSPTIRPNLDLSNVASGAQSLNSMFNDALIRTSYAANGISSMMTARQNSINAVNIQNSDSSRNPVIQKLDELNNNMDRFATNVQNLKVVMNSKAVVGELAPDMDSELGRRQVYKERGVVY